LIWVHPGLAVFPEVLRYTTGRPWPVRLSLPIFLPAGLACCSGLVKSLAGGAREYHLAGRGMSSNIFAGA